MEGREGEYVDDKRMRRFRSGVGNLLYLAKWSRPDIQNITRELSRFFMKTTPAHEKVMFRVMNYCYATKERGLLMETKSKWNGNDRNYEFQIKGVSDSDYAKKYTNETRCHRICSIFGGFGDHYKRKMQSCVKLSVAEAEMMAAVRLCAGNVVY